MLSSSIHKVFIVSVILGFANISFSFASDPQIIITHDPIPGVPLVKMEIAPLPVDNNLTSQEQKSGNTFIPKNWQTEIQSLNSENFPSQSPSALPNLYPYKPIGWDNAIVVSSSPPTSLSNVQEGIISVNQNCYINGAVVNIGTVSVSTPFYTYIYDNGSTIAGLYTPFLPANFYAYVTGILYVFTDSGNHTLKSIADATHTVSESIEADNTYTRTKTINPANKPNLTAYRPPGWSNALVVSPIPPPNLSNVQDGLVYSNQTSYFSGAVLNNGTAPISTTFYTYFYDDGVWIGGGIVTNSLPVNYYAYALGIPYVFTSSGAHTLTLKADVTNVVSESNESDNTYNRTKSVIGPPNAPTNLTAVVVSNTQINLNWSDNSDNETGFGVDYKINNGNWQILTYLGPNVRSLAHTGLTPGNQYCYRVYAFNNAGLSGYSNENCATPWIWDNSMGDFDLSADTIYWSYETPPGVSLRPTLTTLSSYQGHSGILQFGFSSVSQGIKLTSIGRFTPDLGNPWYHLQITYYSDSPSDGHEILSIILLYSNVSSNSIKEVGASYTGNSLIQSGVWKTIDTYIYCHGNSGQLQFILKNRGSSGDMYIDSVILTNESPPAILNPTFVSFDNGDFDINTDTTGWAFENAPGTSNGQPLAFWSSNYSEQTGVLGFNFSAPNQGIKLTSKDLLIIPADKNVIMSFKTLSDLGTPTGLNITGFLFGEKDLNAHIWDVGSYSNSGFIPGNTWKTYYAPLTSSAQTTYRLQLIINNTNQFPEHVYLDDIQVFYNPTITSPGIEKELR